MKKVVKIVLIVIVSCVALFWITIESNPEIATNLGYASGPGKPDEITNTTMETESKTEPTSRPVLDCKSLEAACADNFIDPSKVTVLSGEWAYTADPNKFVALATVRYTDKDDEYEVAEIVMVGTFGGKTELFHHLNEHSPYTRENALQEFGAIDDQRFQLE